MCEQLAILCDLDLYSDEIMSLTPSDVAMNVRYLKWMNELPKEHPKELIFDGVTYTKKPFNEVNVWEWRTLDYYFTNLSDGLYPNFIATCYQVKGEKWGFDLNERAEIFEDAPMSGFDVVGWVKFKNLCFEKYPLAGGKVVEEIPDNENYIQRAERLERERIERINASLNWEKIMLAICKGSPKEAYESMYLPILYIFRIITLIKEGEGDG